MKVRSHLLLLVSMIVLVQVNWMLSNMITFTESVVRFIATTRVVSCPVVTASSCSEVSSGFSTEISTFLISMTLSFEVSLVEALVVVSGFFSMIFTSVMVVVVVVVVVMTEVGYPVDAIEEFLI